MLECLDRIDIDPKTSWRPLELEAVRPRFPRKGSDIVVLTYTTSLEDPSYFSEVDVHYATRDDILDMNTGSVKVVAWNYAKNRNRGMSPALASSICRYLTEGSTLSICDQKKYSHIVPDTERFYTEWFGELNSYVATRVLSIDKSDLGHIVEPLLMSLVGSDAPQRGLILLDRGVLYYMLPDGIGREYVDLFCGVDPYRSHKYPMELISRWIGEGRVTFMSWFLSYGDEILKKVKENTLQKS